MKGSILLTAVMVAMMVGSALAAGGGPGKTFGPEHAMEKQERHLDRMAELLDLSDEQREQVAAIRAEEREQLEPLRKQLEQGRDQLHRLATTLPFDEQAVRAVAASQAELRTEMIVAKVRMKNRIHALLTPEQRKLAERLRPMHQKKHRGDHRRPAEE